MRSFIAIHLVSALVFSFFSFAVPIANAGPADPPGNNGTIKINQEEISDNGNQGNHPHVKCTFYIDFYGYDKGPDLNAYYRFHTISGGQNSTTIKDGTVFIGEDEAGGATDHDASVEVTLLKSELIAAGAQYNQNQGFHIKLTIEADGSIGNNTKSKTFWVEGCDPTTTVEVVKILQPLDDPGRFDLKINKTIYKENAGNGDSTGAQVVDPNKKIVVKETAGDNSSLTNYATQIICENQDQEVLASESRDGAGSRQLTLNKDKVEAGDAIVCTFTNTRIEDEPEYGSITIVKNTVGGDGAFDFTGDLGNFTLTTSGATSTRTFSKLAPGTFSVAETVPAGWDLTNTVCSDQSLVTAISLQANEHITCTFTNTKRGQIVVEKQTNLKGDTTKFSFNPSWSDVSLTLSGGESQESELLAPGNYSVAEENIPTNWKLESAICDNEDVATNIQLEAGETVTCVFTNTYTKPEIPRVEINVSKGFCQLIPELSFWGIPEIRPQFQVALDELNPLQAAGCGDIATTPVTFTLHIGDSSKGEIIDTKTLSEFQDYGWNGTTFSVHVNQTYTICESFEGNYTPWAANIPSFTVLLNSSVNAGFEFTEGNCITVEVGQWNENIAFVNIPTPTNVPTPTPSPIPTPTPKQVLGEQIERPKVLAAITELPSTGVGAQSINLMLSLFLGAVLTRRQIN